MAVVELSGLLINLVFTHVHSPSIITMLYSVIPSMYMSGECTRREQSRVGILFCGVFT